MSTLGHKLVLPSHVDTSLVVASPHSGRDYSWAFLRRSALSELTIRSSEDAYVDQLIQGAEDFGAPTILATVPRAYVDLNRSVDELDPALIEGAVTSGYNPRVMSGLGVIPRVVANGRAIYSGKISMVEAQSRLTDYWHPYHAQLARLLDKAHRLFGQAILMDCHSMPRESLDGVVSSHKHRPEVVLGDRFGASAHPDIVDQIEACFERAGFKVWRNTPFAGAYIAQSYGRPSRNQHVVQVEIDRSIYMDERKLVPNDNFLNVRSAMRQVLSEVADIARVEGLPLAAE